MELLKLNENDLSIWIGILHNDITENIYNTFRFHQAL